MADQNLVWVKAPVTWGMRLSWAETICSIEVMASGLVSEDFLIVLPEFLPLVLHAIFWEFPNKQATQGGGSDLDYLPGYYPPLG